MFLIMAKIDANLTHYIATTAVVVRDGKFLIAKRADFEKAFPGKWTVPGGKVKVLDYALKKVDTQGAKQWYNVLEDGVIREVEEEVGLKINRRDLGYITSLVYIRDDEIPCLVISLYAECKEGVVVLDRGMTDYKWVSLEEAKGYDLIDGIYHELEILEEHLKSGNGILIVL
jgi:8-oxo-dGTP pyrophosphatase MutT (NUDIX family)